MMLNKFFWINEPKNHVITTNTVKIETEKNTDFWQRTYYGFRNDNAHTFVIAKEDRDFTFYAKCTMVPNKLFDQCGIAIYQDSDNWMKASLEYDAANVSKLGSVVTNYGFSDWASKDISSAVTEVWYRLSRRGDDFCIESSLDGESYELMRIFHMFKPIEILNVGIYACSPQISTVEVLFEDIRFTECEWEPFDNPDK